MLKEKYEKMSSLKDIQDYIDQYRLGKISEPEFKQRLESDGALQHEYKLYERDLNVIKSAAKKQLRKKANLLLENHENKSQKIFPLKRVMQVAAAIIFIAVSFFLIHNIGQPPTNSELFASHFELPPPEGERNSSTQSELWNKAMNSYTNQDFKKSIESISSLIKEPDFQFKERGRLYLGLSYLVENEYQEAINNFNTINSNSSYYQKAEWYIALSFLKMENKVNAKIAFQKIVEQPHHFKQREAKMILDNI